ncbi:hypothetical protein JBE38_13775 [Pseudomonas sp. ICBG1301]|uniref:hypothetical protein n=1 Tax=Pseudomonas sp. ICBG1301 TaxID=2795987 RepID=UPI001963DF20|nr:hypothetical protein [Pseudomonas sp. ICBG1301]MBM9486995.1 hypothetical protein [Pseudomonas sp. ICBG1301]
MSRQPETPAKIQVKANGGSFEVHWDFRNAPDTLTLRTECERLDGFINGFIDGALVALEIPLEHICLTGSSKGTVKELDQNLANKVASIVENLFLLLLAAQQKKLRPQTGPFRSS